MDWTSILGNVASGGVLGLVGNALSFGLNYFKARQEFAQQTTLIKLQSDARMAESASAIAVAREQGAAAAFASSIQAEGGISGEHRWARTFRAITRPGLTWSALLATITCAVFSIDNSMTAGLDAYTGMMVAWWFGQRAIDRSTITWGTAATKGQVASAPTK